MSASSSSQTTARACPLHVVVVVPDDLIAEELSVVGRVEVRLGRLGRVELQTLANALAQDVQRRVGLHNLCHRLLQQRLEARRPVAEAGLHVVRQVESDEHTSRRRVERHRVGREVQELRTNVALDVVLDKGETNKEKGTDK